MQLAMKQLLLFPLEDFTVQRESKRRVFSPIKYLTSVFWDDYLHAALKVGTFMLITGITSIPTPIRNREVQRMALVIRRKNEDEDEALTPRQLFRYRLDSLKKDRTFLRKQARIRKKQRAMILAQSKYQSFNN